MPTTEKNPKLIEHARSLANTKQIWCEDYEKMISGMLYNPFVPELMAARLRARQITKMYNEYCPDDATVESLERDREIILKDLFGHVGPRATLEIPFRVDYGCNVSFGAYFYSNFNLTILDGGLVTFGDRVMVGPNVCIGATSHPTDPNDRRRVVGSTFSKEVTVGNDCWIGAGTIIIPGVTLGKGVVIGANSVVTRDIPSFSVAVGAPARVIKKVNPAMDVPKHIMDMIIKGQLVSKPNL